MPVLENVLGKDLAAKVHAGASTDGKARLETNTTAAIEDGAFGMPWFVTTDANGQKETFWGVDHLGQVCNISLIFYVLGRPWRTRMVTLDSGSREQVVEALGLDRPESGWRSLL